jgi:TPR repeat protein
LNLKALNKRALKGDALAQYWMGKTYLEGRLGCKKDTTLAIKWLELGAINGEAWAQHDLARLYYYGLGVEVNREAAYKLYKQCANNSSASKAIKFEAKMYYAEALGKGLYEEKKDIKKAIEIASEAKLPYWATGRLSDKAQAQQETLLGFLNYELTTETDDIEEKKTLFNNSVKHYKNAVERLNIFYQKYSSHNLQDFEIIFIYDSYVESYTFWGHSLFFINMITDNSDYTEIMKIYQLAIDFGSDSAMYMVGNILYSGKGNIPADKAKAISLFSQLAERSVEATYRLATYYYTEEIDYPIAFKYYKAIAEDNSEIDNSVRADVLQHLSKMYLFGRGVEVDNDMADKYAQEAIKYGDVDSNAISNFLNQTVLSSNSITITR